MNGTKGSSERKDRSHPAADCRISLRNRVTLFSLIILMLMTVSLTAYFGFESRYDYRNGDWKGVRYLPDYNRSRYSVVLDTHSHTTVSDGVLTPEQNIRWHLANGFNSAVITDHNTIEGAIRTRDVAREKYDGVFLVILGMEWTTDRIHLNLVGVTDRFEERMEMISRDVPRDPSDSEIREVIELTHRSGGIVIVNHYERSGLQFGSGIPSRSELIDWGVDYFEVVNSKDVPKTGVDVPSLSYAQGHDVGLCAGTDMHDPSEIRVHGWTLLAPDEFTEGALFIELRNRNSTFIVEPDGVPYSAKHDLDIGYMMLEPFIATGGMIVVYSGWPRLDWISIMLLFGYIYGVMVVYEAGKRTYIRIAEARSQCRRNVIMKGKRRTRFPSRSN